MKHRKEDLKEIIKYCKGEPSELSDQQKNKLDRLAFALDLYLIDAYTLSEIIEMLMLKFGICEQTARQDALDFPLIASPNYAPLLVDAITNSIRKTIAIYEKLGKHDKVLYANMQLSKHIKDHPSKEKEEQKQLPAVIVAQFNLELLPNFAQMSLQEIEEKRKIYLKKPEQDTEFEIVP